MTPNSNEQLVIRPKRSRKSKILIASIYLIVFLFAIGSATYLGFRYGANIYDLSARSLADLKESHKQLKSNYEELLLQEAKLVQGQNVQQAAYIELEKIYELVDQRNEFLNRRVNFYRSILSPDDGISGVRIHNVNLIEEQKTIFFEITLIQSINHERDATAKVYVELYETKEGRKPLARWQADNQNFKFKFFETVEGSVVSDKNIDNMFLKIIVLPNGDSTKQLVEWHEV